MVPDSQLGGSASDGFEEQGGGHLNESDKVEAAVVVAGTKQSVEKVDGKLEAVIKANSLKRTTG